MLECHDPLHTQHHRGVKNSALYSFSTRSDLYNHTQLQHPDRSGSSNNSETLENLALSKDVLLGSCPLCCFPTNEVEHSVAPVTKEKSEKEQHISEEESGQRKKLTIKTVAFQTDVPDVIEKSDDEVLPINTGYGETEADSSTSLALSKHIAAHLQFLMVLSLRLMSTLDLDDGEDGDGNNPSFAPATGASPSGEPFPGRDSNDELSSQSQDSLSLSLVAGMETPEYPARPDEDITPGEAASFGVASPTLEW
jgi:hypothetical protein